MVFTSLCRINIINSAVLLVLPILFVLYSTSVYSQEDPQRPFTAEDALEEELRYLKAETYVITPSRVPEDIKKTASSVTVITDRQIRQMGARNLADVLKTVPGMNHFDDITATRQIFAGGTMTYFSSDILIMINSHPLNENHTGGAVMTHDTLMLDNVKRIEFVRGPGSALYGANAFSGVINIITKQAEDIDGWELTARGGSYDTQQYNLLYGKTFNDLEIVFNYNFFNTHGYNGHVNEDLQTVLDQRFFSGPNVSLAPGRMKGDDEKYDASLNLKYKGFTFDGRYVDRDRDLALGFYSILDEKSTNSPEDYYLNLSYERTLWEGFDVMGKVYWNHNLFHSFFQFFPAGSPWGPIISPQESLVEFSAKNNRTGFEIQTTYKMGDTNTLVTGITYEEMKQYDVRTRGNFLYTPFPVPFVFIYLPRMQYLPDIQNNNKSAKRNFKAFFIEDIWDIRDNLRLTAGVRYDDYSDFGDSTNPRVGLTWEFIKGYDLKLLYGTAFRAPSFIELYNFLVGNPDLDPEEVDTYQVSLGAEFTPSLSARITWFRNDKKDFIHWNLAFGPDYYRNKNFGNVRSEGVIVEMKYDFGRGTYLALNHTYLTHKKRRSWVIPRYTGNIMANIRLSKYFNFYASCHIEDGFRRDREDNRDDMSGYAVVNATLIAKKFLKGYENLEIRGSVYNLFDKDYTAPTTEGVQKLPNDYPMPGRSFIVGVKYKF